MCNQGGLLILVACRLPIVIDLEILRECITQHRYTFSNGWFVLKSFFFQINPILAPIIWNKMFQMVFKNQRIIQLLNILKKKIIFIKVYLLKFNNCGYCGPDPTMGMFGIHLVYLLSNTHKKSEKGFNLLQQCLGLFSILLVTQSLQNSCKVEW